MLALSQTQLNSDIGIIQLLHSRLGLDLAKTMAYHVGNFMYIHEMNKKNMMIGKYVDILNLYTITGDETVTEVLNVLTVDDIQSIIDDCYREMDKYNV